MSGGEPALPALKVPSGFASVGGIGAVVLSCEHAVPDVPRALASCFGGAERLLASHRGYDRGALETARNLKGVLGRGVPLVATRASRLVIDTNRSLDHPEVFSTRTRSLDEASRDRIVASHWRSHRQRVREAVEEAFDRVPGQAVLHLGVHSFTPVLRGVRRSVDIGLLYDPSRQGERVFCALWARELRRRLRYRVRANRPYRGTEDGLTTTLRSEFRADRYLGVELELNQRFVRRGGTAWVELQVALAESLVAALAALRSR